MLKYRLIFGTLLTAVFIGLMLLDGWMDGSITLSPDDDALPQGTVLFALICLMIVPVQHEISRLVQDKYKVSKLVTIPCSFLLVLGFYLYQFCQHCAAFGMFYYILFAVSAAVLTAFAVQAVKYGTENTVQNCAVNIFFCLYPAFLSGFVIGIRTHYGLYAFLMFVLVVKSSDIGAYTVGRLFGKHKLSPRISPGKTWEGLAGAVCFAAAVSLIWTGIFHVMPLLWSCVFGAVFAVAGQLGDLAESMIKRDMNKKDSAGSVPGFGGILDIIDSPAAAAPLAFLFFMMIEYLTR